MVENGVPSSGELGVIDGSLALRLPNKVKGRPNEGRPSGNQIVVTEGRRSARGCGSSGTSGNSGAVRLSESIKTTIGLTHLGAKAAAHEVLKFLV